MTAFREWLQDNKPKDDLTLSNDDYYYTLEFVEMTWNAALEAAAELSISRRGHFASDASSDRFVELLRGMKEL